jgi:hypothetical protein
MTMADFFAAVRIAQAQIEIAQGNTERLPVFAPADLRPPIFFNF